MPAARWSVRVLVAMCDAGVPRLVVVSAGAGLEAQGHGQNPSSRRSQFETVSTAALRRALPSASAVIRLGRI